MDDIDSTATYSASRTAALTALARAVHVLHRGPRALLCDWLAWPLVGPDAETMLAAQRPALGTDEVPFAAWYAARSRLTEDWLAESGADQYLVLGAGLDTFAWRQPGSVRVFEVDHPATQGWKLQRLAALGLSAPDALTCVPVDFERQDLDSALEAAGVGATGTLFASWLGVVPYLTRDAISATLRALPACTLAIGYLPPADEWDEDARRLGAHMDAMVRALGEPWLTLTSSADFAALMSDCGFAVLADVGAHDIEARYGIRALNYERMALARKKDPGERA